MKYTILNFAYGYGPFLRTMELALEINKQLENSGRERLGIIVPLVYGEKQKRIMFEEFGHIIDNNPGEIWFDEKIGAYLNSIFFGDKKYNESLQYYLDNYHSIKEELDRYFSDGLAVADFYNKEKTIIKNSEISFVISRAPRIEYPIELSYNVSFALITDILRQTIIEKVPGIDLMTVEKIIPIYEKIENRQTLQFVAEPGTFFYDSAFKRKDVIYTPPNSIEPVRFDYPEAVDGLYVTITGIPQLDYLYEEARKIGLKIYTNKPETIKSSEQARPSILYSGKIRLHFARAGWGSIWLSLYARVPFITMPYAPGDDPEIYFNNRCIEKSGLGIIYHGQELSSLLDFKPTFESSVDKTLGYLSNNYGASDGVRYSAEKIINNFYKNETQDISG